MAKPRYSKPATQVDLERRQKEGHAPRTTVDPGVDPTLSKNGYIGVDEVYQNAANPTERPVEVTKGPESQVFDEFLHEDVEYPALNDGGEDDAEEETTSPSQTPPASTPPPSGSDNSNS